MKPVLSRPIRALISLLLLSLWALISLDLYRSARMQGAANQYNPFAVQIAVFGAATLLLLVVTAILAILWFPERSRAVGLKFIELRERLGKFNWGIAVLLAVLPGWLLLYTPLGELFSSGYMRLIILLITGLLVAIITTQGTVYVLRWSSLVFGILFSATIFVFAFYLTGVTSYPFSLYWSEGNRLYDYSIPFGKDLYQYDGLLTLDYGAAGRYMLWGFIFLLPDLPIWIHRFWNFFLSTVPLLAFGYLLARWSKLNGFARWLYAMWIFLFLAQGPIYTPLILSAILLVLTVRPPRWVLAIIGAALAGYYASLSRWTWLPASATWAGFMLLADFQFQKDEKWLSTLRRLAPVAAVSIAGLVGGLLADPRLFQPAQLAGGTSLAQPLLWYRLFPNPTYSEGILISLLIAVLPVAALLVWFAASRRWKLNWLQVIAFSLPSLIFLAAGLVISVKIGGGNNLHNLDLFLVSLAFLTAILVRDLSDQSYIALSWFARIAMALAVLIPAWNAVRVGTPIHLPPAVETAEALKVVVKQAGRAAQEGEVLFMDQRQLLTFGLIQDIPLVPEYEKKYLMDQAMASNEDYFEKFYQDLREKRFSLIIAPPLFVVEKGPAFTWGEENNAWQDWIVAPVLCYYKPMRTFLEDDVQLLIPRDTPKNCPASLEIP